MNNKEINLGAVQKTLLLPLWSRAFETQKNKSLLVDKTAVNIIQNMEYDFSIFERIQDPLSRIAWIARSLYFDSVILSFLKQNPDGTIINAGCGLDTTFDRIDNGKAYWYEIDLSDVIELRKKYIKENEHRIIIADSILSNDWCGKIKHNKRILVLFAGLLYYFNENDVKKIFTNISEHLGSCEIVFDYSSPKGVEVANKKVLEKSGMSNSVKLLWGIGNINKIKEWGNIEIIESLPMFKRFKKNYPIIKRIGMNISDMLKIMSLAHIKIEKRSV